MFQTTNQYIYIYIYLEIIPSTAAHHGLLSVKFPCVTCILHPSFHLHIFLQFSYPLPSDTDFAPPFCLSMMSQFKCEKKTSHDFPKIHNIFPDVSQEFPCFLNNKQQVSISFPSIFPLVPPLHTTRRCPARKAASSCCSTAQSTAQKAPRPSACCSDGLAARRALARPGGGGQRSKTCHFSVFSD